MATHLMRGRRPMALSFREDVSVRSMKDLPSWVADFGVHLPPRTPSLDLRHDAVDSLRGSLLPNGKQSVKNLCS